MRETSNLSTDADMHYHDYGEKKTKKTKKIKQHSKCTKDMTTEMVTLLPCQAKIDRN